MRAHIRTVLVAAISIGMLAGCAQAMVDAAANPPAAVSEPIPGSDLLRITLTEGAVARLAIETTRVTEDLAIPYGALLYDAQGEAWAYTNPEPLVYVRASIEVERIVGDRVLVSGGPPPGTAVVSVGAAELYGVESGVGGGH